LPHERSGPMRRWACGNVVPSLAMCSVNHPSCNTDQGVHVACESKGLNTWRRSESVDDEPARGLSRPCLHEAEQVGCDPKDGELCPGRMKPVETPVEVRSG